MRFLSIAIVAALAACISAAKTCDPGRGLDDKDNCKKCPANQFGTGGSTPCRDCPAGSHSSEGSAACRCDDGYYSPNGSTTGDACAVCPAGHISNRSNTNCTQCGANKYAIDNECRDCPDGFTSPPGSTSCTPRCQAGYKVKPNGQCEICPAGTYSAAGDTRCRNCPNGYTSNPGSSACTPEPSRRPANPSRRAMCSGTGMKQCNVWSGKGGVECINVLTTLDSCGGCVGPEGDNSSEYTGQDCSAIPNADEVKCIQGKCHIQSCRRGYEPSGSSCVESAAHVHSRAVKRSYSRHDSF